MRKHAMRTKWKEKLVLPAFLLVLLVFGLLLVRQYRVSTPPEPIPAAPVAEALPRREVTLYFSSADGRQLVAEARQIDGCRDDASCLSATVAALLHGPLGELQPLFPDHAVVHTVTVEGGTASVDLSREALAEHPGGSMAELLSVVGLADTLAANFPYVRAVRLLIDGAPIETLKGHVDLRQPVQADFSLVRNAPRAPRS